jgi:hypothetical protein
VIAYGSLELSSFLVLKLGFRFHISYWPIAPKSLFEPDRKAIEKLIAKTDTYLTHHPVLGWSIKPNGVSPDRLFRANSQGFRANREYSMNPTRTRILAFGDSFTHADEVTNQEMWTNKLEEKNNLEVLNFGVGGYGPDQAFLRYLDVKDKFKSNIVLIGIMSENINRVVNVFRAFYTPQSMPLTKPRFLLSSDEKDIRLQPNPFTSLKNYEELLKSPEPILAKLAANDYWYKLMPHQCGWDLSPTVQLGKTAKFWYGRALSPNSIVASDGLFRDGTEAIIITKLILDKFYGEVKKAGSTPVIVLFPSHRDILRQRKNGKRRYQVLIEHAKSQNYRFIDLLDGFDKLKGTYTDGRVLSHYNPSENEVVTKSIYQYLVEQQLIK